MFTKDTNASNRYHTDDADRIRDATDRMRRGFTGDCASLEAIARKMKRSGVALLFDANGDMEVYSLNAGADHIDVSKEGQHVTVEHEEWNRAGPRSEKQRDDTQRMVEEASENSYSQMAGENWEKAVAHSHERANRAGNNFPPQVHEGPPRSIAKKQPTGDAAKRAKLTADARREYQAGIARTEKFAQQIKDASNKMWAGRR